MRKERLKELAAEKWSRESNQEWLLGWELDQQLLCFVKMRYIQSVGYSWASV